MTADYTSINTIMSTLVTLVALVTSVTPALLTLVLICPGHVARSRVKIVSHYLQPHAHNGDLVSGSTKN